MPSDLVDCPSCGGWGWHEPSEKLCLCLLVDTGGWNPGKVPRHIAEIVEAKKLARGCQRRADGHGFEELPNAK